jgi:hypothetical protein
LVNGYFAIMLIDYMGSGYYVNRILGYLAIMLIGNGYLAIMLMYYLGTWLLAIMTTWQLAIMTTWQLAILATCNHDY